jgi:peptidoglycan/xylan/chitin deacetylase (PgdA/CDA1 family)
MGEPALWDDIRLETLRHVVELIGPNWAVPCQGQSTLIRNGWMLTFDDGNASDYEIVYPLLAENNIRATFFVVSAQIGKPGRVTASQIREMHDHGMCFGSHSSTHRRMTLLTEDEARREFTESRKQIEDIVGEQIDTFSYPYGECTRSLHRLGFASGYRRIFTSAHGIYDSNLTVLPRNAIYSIMRLEQIDATMSPTYGLRARWWLEDRAKTAVKALVGSERYIWWRARWRG